MFAEERRHAISQRLRQSGRADVSELAASFGVTAETVRRDLQELAHQGLIRRTHGGAVSIEHLEFEPDMSRRRDTMADEKRRIARTAVDLVPPEGSIFIEAGSTNLALADALPRDRDLTVVTNSLPVAVSLAGWPRLTVLTVGGRVRARSMAEVDEWALRSMAELHVEVAFLGANGLSVQHGLSTPDPAEAAVKRAALRVGRRSVLLCDHTKFGNDSLLSYARLEELDLLITDSAVSAHHLKEVSELDLEVVLA